MSKAKGKPKLIVDVSSFSRCPIQFTKENISQPYRSLEMRNISSSVFIERQFTFLMVGEYAEG